MADDFKENRKPYLVSINGIDHELLLSPEDADRYGEAARPVKAATAKSTKSRTPANK